MRRTFDSPAQAVVAVASLCLSLPIAVVLAQGNAAKLYHLHNQDGRNEHWEGAGETQTGQKMTPIKTLPIAL